MGVSRLLRCGSLLHSGPPRKERHQVDLEPYFWCHFGLEIGLGTIRNGFSAKHRTESWFQIKKWAHATPFCGQINVPTCDRNSNFAQT